MSAKNLQNHCFSAHVRIHLHVNGQVFKIGQLGPDFIILDNPADQPPGEAEIAMSIDGRERRWPVRLPDGVRAGMVETRTTDWHSADDGAAAD
jgi:hypothetical protein